MSRIFSASAWRVRPGIKSLLALAAACVFCTNLSAETEAEYAARINANTEKIQRLETEVADAKRQRAAMAAKLASADGKIQGRSERILELKQDIRQFNSRVEGIEASLLDSQALIATTRKSLGRLMRTSLQVRSNDGLQVMLQHTNPALSSRLGIYYDYFFRATTARIDNESHLLEASREAHQEALKSRNWLKYLEKKATSQKTLLTGDKSDQKQRLTKLDTTLRKKEQLVEDLRKDQQRLGKLLEELRKNALGASGLFAHSKGKYPWPVAGKRLAGFGEKKSVGKVTWQGLFITAEAGRSVRAIANGEIVYADWLQGFGMLVIIDHGDSFMTLYGGNRELQVEVGEWIESGSPIATVGDSGGQNKAGLYFEIRHNAKPVDPELWVDSKNRFAKKG